MSSAKPASCCRILQGGLRVQIENDYHRPKTPLNRATTAVFEGLRKKTQQMFEGQTVEITYRSAIEDLETAFRRYSNVQEEPGLVFIWGIMVSEQFMTELRKKEPMALLLLAHYAVLLHSICGLWWSGERGKQLVYAISQILPFAWQSAMVWPKQATNDSMAFETRVFE